MTVPTVVQVEPETKTTRIPGFYQGSYGVVVVDTQSGDQAEALRSAVRRLSTGPVRFIINTHVRHQLADGGRVCRRLENRRAVRGRAAIHLQVRELRDVLREGIGGAPFPFLVQHHHRDAGDRLGHRVDAEDRVPRERCPGREIP